MIAPFDAPLKETIMELPPIKALEDQEECTIICNGETLKVISITNQHCSVDIC